LTTLLTNKRIDEVRAEFTKRFDEIHSDLINRIDANNTRIDRFFETAVTKYEHGKMEERVTRLECEVEGNFLYHISSEDPNHHFF